MGRLDLPDPYRDEDTSVDSPPKASVAGDSIDQLATEAERFVRAWLGSKDRPGFYMRAGQPWVDWEAWALGIREGWITDEGFWNGA